jgi:predicted membrane metal-binding protein
MISGRQNNPLSIILLTAFFMLILSPLSLNYDVSFHLSFLAVLGIIYTQKFFDRIFYFLPEIFAIKESLVLTLSSLSFTLPIMIFNF